MMKRINFGSLVTNAFQRMTKASIWLWILCAITAGATATSQIGESIADIITSSEEYNEGIDDFLYSILDEESALIEEENYLEDYTLDEEYDENLDDILNSIFEEESDVILDSTVSDEYYSADTISRDLELFIPEEANEEYFSENYGELEEWSFPDELAVMIGAVSIFVIGITAVALIVSLFVNIIMNHFKWSFAVDSVIDGKEVVKGKSIGALFGAKLLTGLIYTGVVLTGAIMMVVLISFEMYILAMILFIAIIVIAVIITVKYSAIYYVASMYPRLGVKDIIRKTNEITKGNKMKIWGYRFLFGFILSFAEMMIGIMLIFTPTILMIVPMFIIGTVKAVMVHLFDAELFYLLDSNNNINSNYIESSNIYREF